MTSNRGIGFGLLWLAVCVLAQPAEAQFGQLFGKSVETVTTRELQKLLTSQPAKKDGAEIESRQRVEAPPVLVDVRSHAETSVSIIPGAITKEHFEKNRDSYRGRPVITYCTVGGRSNSYAKQLARQGVQVKNYSGSILDWVRSGLPLVTLDGEATNRVHTYSARHRVPSNYVQVTE